MSLNISHSTFYNKIINYFGHIIVVKSFNVEKESSKQTEHF